MSTTTRNRIYCFQSYKRGNIKSHKSMEFMECSCSELSYPRYDGMNWFVFVAPACAKTQPKLQGGKIAWVNITYTSESVSLVLYMIYTKLWLFICKAWIIPLTSPSWLEGRIMSEFKITVVGRTMSTIHRSNIPIMPMIASQMKTKASALFYFIPSNQVSW